MSDQASNPIVVEGACATRDEFVRLHPYLFVYGEPGMQKPSTGAPTVVNMPALRRIDTSVAEESSRPFVELVVAPIRKRTELFADMITVGRVANNDIVIADETVSKFHAYFRAVETGWELFDAGSRNGTKVMGRKIIAREGTPVSSGIHVRFGAIDLLVLDAGATWDKLQRRRHA